MEEYPDSREVMVAGDGAGGNSCRHVRMDPENLCMCLPSCLTTEFAFYFLPPNLLLSRIVWLLEEKYVTRSDGRDVGIIRKMRSEG